MVEAAKGDVETVVRKVTLDLFRKVVLRSPVDTGRFRANWNVSYGTPDVTVTASKIKSRGDAEAAKALTLPVGGVTWLANGLPYSERLEYGWSKQAPGGMVRLATAEFASIASKAKP
jgi:hypothetical protein